MSKNTDDYYRKISKWTDDINKDTKYFGVGSVNNHTHLASGRSVDKPNEDRYFNYEFKKNTIYAYGLLDGYNGEEAVDLVDQCLLTNIYFDHLELLEERNDDEIFEMLDNDFQKTENTLYENAKDIYAKIAQLNIDLADIPKGTLNYKMHQRDIKALNNQLNSGVFALVALLVNNRLFISNVGQINCFVCLIDKNATNKLKVVPLQTDHTIHNIQEVLRLANLKADIEDFKSLQTDKDLDVKYTRCLGDFKSKANYKELTDIFKTCTSSPIVAVAGHPPKSITIDDSYLFLVMYTDAVSETIKKTQPDQPNIDVFLADRLMSKIKSELTLNSAAQSVLDEIKRAYDDKFAASFCERGDLTLLIRAFDANLKARIHNLLNQNLNKNEVLVTNESGMDEDDTNTSDEILDSLEQFDSIIINNEVVPYVDFEEFNQMIKDDDELAKLTNELSLLGNEAENDDATTRI